jgi:hypothetical protein
MPTRSPRAEPERNKTGPQPGYRLSELAIGEHVPDVDKRERDLVRPRGCRPFQRLRDSQGQQRFVVLAKLDPQLLGHCVTPGMVLCSVHWSSTAVQRRRWVVASPVGQSDKVITL